MWIKEQDWYRQTDPCFNNTLKKPQTILESCAFPPIVESSQEHPEEQCDPHVHSCPVHFDILQATGTLRKHPKKVVAMY